MVNALGDRNLNFIPAVTVPIDDKGIHAPIVSLSGNADFKPSNNVILSPHLEASVNTGNSQVGASAGMMTQVSLSENVLLKVNAAVTAANIGDTNDLGVNAQLSITGQVMRENEVVVHKDLLFVALTRIADYAVNKKSGDVMDFLVTAGVAAAQKGTYSAIAGWYSADAK